MRFLVIFILIAISTQSHGLTSSDVKLWNEDIDAYSKELIKRHIDPFHSTTESQFNNEVQRIKRELPNKSINEVLVELMRLTHSIGDGHTSFPLWGWDFSHLPFEFKVFKQGIYVVKTVRQYKYLLGAKLEFIGGVPSENILGLLSFMTPFSENKYSSAVRAAEYMTKAEVLNGLGVIQDVSTVSLAFEVDGKSKTLLINTSKAPKLTESLMLSHYLVYEPIEKLSDDLWFGSSSDKKVIYFKFRRYTSIPKMQSLAEDLLSFIDKNQSKKLIIDLRDNYGGNFFVGLKLAELLVLADSIDWKSGVYVLVDNVTFSAAMSNAAQFSQLLNARLVGEPTGARPSGYQDMGQFTLPNSKLAVSYSKRLYHFKEGTKDALYPDVGIELSVEDYLKGRDRHLDWVLGDILNKQSTNIKSTGVE